MKTVSRIFGCALIFTLLLGFLSVKPVSADSVIVYNAVPATLPPNMPSVGFQAYQTAEIGDYVHLAGTNRLLKTVTVTMSAWALQEDYPAMTDPTGWDHPITLNIYNAIPGTPNTLGSLITTKTQLTHIPWRPEGDDTCPIDYPPHHKWRASDGQCYNGYAFNITFDLSSLNVVLPDDIIIGVAYNTNTWGYAPIGAPGPYESLNVGALGSTTVGTDESTDKLFWNTLTAAWYADGGAGGVGVFREDSNWTPNGTIPFQITADVVPALCTTDCYVATTGSDSNLGNVDTPFLTIQKGIDTASAGGTVHVAAGTYVTNLAVNKRVSIIGAGSGSGGTIVTSPAVIDYKVGVLQVSASGISGQPILFKDLRILPVSQAGISVGRFTESTGQNVDYLSLENVQVIGTNSNPATEQERGLYVDNTSTLNHLTIVDSGFNNLTYGWYFQKSVSADTSTVSNVSVTNTTFNLNSTKGIYVEKLTDAVFTNVTVLGNGSDDTVLPPYFSPWKAGVDVNLKAGSYANISFIGCTIVNNGTGDAKEGVGLTVKARNDGATYGAFPATLNNVLITNSTITGNERGIRIGEPGKGNAGPTNVVIRLNRISGNAMKYSGSDGSAYGGIVNQSGASVTAENNWFGCNEGANQPGCDGAVAASTGTLDFTPWLVMNITNLPATMAPLATSAFTADLTDNSALADTSALGYLPSSTLVGFTPIANVAPDSDLLDLGVAATTFTAPVASGTVNVCAVLDNETLCDTVEVPDPTVTYVDASWAGTTPGTSVAPTYPVGAPAAVFGFNAFSDLHDALSAIAAGSQTSPSLVYVHAGSYGGTGSIVINKNWVTVKMATGAVIQNASPCFTVAADYVTIQADSLAGAKCVPTADADGIIVTGARRNLTLEKFEIDGAAGDDGVYFDGVITDLVIADLYIHNLTANGLLFAAQPAGVLDIHGNMFRDNAGNGIEAGEFSVPAEFNSWGSYDGATAGDGASTNVDWTPWTHVDLYTTNAGTPWTSQVVRGSTITYTVWGNLQNVSAADFTFRYPANLTFVSSTLGGNFNPADEGSEVLNQSSGVLHFVAYKYGAGLTGHLPLFTATFTGATVGTGAMNLDDTDDGFGMATAGSSTNIYAYELVDGSVTVIDLPTMDIVPTAPYIAGLPIPFTIAINNTAGAAYTALNLDFTLPAGAILEYLDGATWIAAADPFALGALATGGTLAPQFRVTFVDAGTNSMSVALMDTLPAPDFQLATATEEFITLGNFTITGTFSMQGRTERSGIPVTLTKSTAPIYGPFTGITINVISGNLTITNVNGGTYLITTNQPRYLNLSAAENKTILVDGDKTLGPLPPSLTTFELRGGNAVWTDNMININDASYVGYRYGTVSSGDADVNFDGIVNIQDMALIGGNYGVTSATAYGVGNSSGWVPVP